MKRSGKLVILCVAAFWAAGSLAAAEIRGTVRDTNSQPLAGVLVRIEPGGRSLITDEKGGFAFSVDDFSAELQLTFASRLHYHERRRLAPGERPRLLKVYLVPLKLLKEEVTVTALDEAQTALSVPFAQNTVPRTALMENLPETVVQAVQNAPGLSFVGKGGVSVTPSIRGLARRRVLLLAGGARIVSDRSAGASAQFYPPEMIQRIEVVRSAASVLYGSDAMGGVIQIIPRAAAEPGAPLAAINLSGHATGSQWTGGFSLSRKIGRWSLRAGWQSSRAGDYSSPAGRVYNSGFAYSAGNLALAYETAKSGFSLNFLKAAGRDVGKPERENDPAVSSYYPEENTNLLNLAYRHDDLLAGGSLQASFFLNPNDYELAKVKDAGRRIDIAKNKALDFGARVSWRKSFSPRLTCQAGIDCFARAGVDMKNETWRSDELSASSRPLREGRRRDLGLFLTTEYAGSAAGDLFAGVRLGAFSRQALADGVFREKSQFAPAFFFGVTRKIKNALTLFVNAGTAFRMPSLSEAFYTGISGRSAIVGNPDLAPESSFNLDAGLKLHRRNAFVGVYLFQCSIRNMIEKFPLGDEAYTYDNVERGRIRGLETEFQFQPAKGLELFGNALLYRGISTLNRQSLNDVPGARLFLGARLWLGRFWGEWDWLAAAAVRHPGPAENAIPAYAVHDIKAGCYVSRLFSISLKIANLFNRRYYANADPDIPLARGLDLSLGLNLNF